MAFHLRRAQAMAICGLLALCGCSPGGDPRRSEVWVIDFQTYGDEVEATISELDLDMLLLEDLTLQYLDDYFEDLPVFFELGVTGNRLKNSICIRHGDGGIGRGALDIGNESVNHDRGEPNGVPRGAFIDAVALFYAPQVAGEGYDQEQQTSFFARLLALVVAHEIGHGLGLVHTTGIMASLPDFDIQSPHHFTPTQKAEIELNLPR